MLWARWVWDGSTGRVRSLPPLVGLLSPSERVVDAEGGMVLPENAQKAPEHKRELEKDQTSYGGNCRSGSAGFSGRIERRLKVYGRRNQNKTPLGID